MKRSPIRKFSLLFVLAGCVASRMAIPEPPTTAVRLSLIDSAGTILEKALRAEGWEFEITKSTKLGQAALNTDESWGESSIGITFTTRRIDGVVKSLSTQDSAVILKDAKSEIRRLIQAGNGEVLDTTEGEAYRERSLTVSYRIDKSIGIVKANIAPASGQCDETSNRLEMTVREQSAK